MKRVAFTTVYLLATAAFELTAQTANPPARTNHVLLISIDGMHALDFANCSQGVSGVPDGSPYCPNLALLAQTGTAYPNALTSRPSDSFPGLIAQVTGGTTRTAGVFYDVSYDRALSPPRPRRTELWAVQATVQAL